MKKYVLALSLLAAATASAQVADSANPYVRKPRSAAVSLEAGMNSLSSMLGVKGTIFVTPQFAVDAGLGISNVGLRPGVYARWLFSKAKFTPFVYGGAKYGLGSGGQSVPIEDPESGDEFELEVKPSPFIDFGVGIDYLAHNGFYFTAGLGWSQLLGGENYEWIDSPPDDLDDAAKFVLGSGPGLWLSLGYAF